VIAQHPSFPFGYAPGEVISYLMNERKLMVRFYDFTEVKERKEESKVSQ
jgi:hypothetical protein